jgi:hypothetical protein
MYADKTVATLPIALHVQTDPCAICYNEVGERGPFVDMPCRHSMHRECLREWFRRSRTCPVCRAPVSVPDVPVTNVVNATDILLDMREQIYMAHRRRLIRQTNAILARYSVEPISDQPLGSPAVSWLATAVWQFTGGPMYFAG